MFVWRTRQQHINQGKLKWKIQFSKYLQINYQKIWNKKRMLKCISQAKFTAANVSCCTEALADSSVQPRVSSLAVWSCSLMTTMTPPTPVSHLWSSSMACWDPDTTGQALQSSSTRQQVREGITYRRSPPSPFYSLFPTEILFLSI